MTAIDAGPGRVAGQYRTAGVCPRCGAGRWRHEAHDVCGGCGAVAQHETPEITRPSRAGGERGAATGAHRASGEAA